ncbi:MAG: 30S ribosomal protein S20 [Deltaproteobacteria bacterium]|nr:30S ribosomal protein S20 [Deltaproteobacteria bacterium]
MANHPSAEKRARQAIKRKTRNNKVRSQVHTAERAVREAKDSKGAQEALKKAFHTIQKSRGVVHRNTIRRKMARLSKAAARVSKAS